MMIRRNTIVALLWGTVQPGCAQSVGYEDGFARNDVSSEASTSLDATLTCPLATPQTNDLCFRGGQCRYPCGATCECFVRQGRLQFSCDRMCVPGPTRFDATVPHG